LYEYKISIT